MLFKDLEIIEPILRALADKNYTEPTPIQAKAIPLILKKIDVLGCAQTGTGKTAAFSIPIIQQLHETIEKESNSKIKIRALIVTPTRELAIQIDENINAYCKYTRLNHTVIFGGVKQNKQVNAIKNGVDILVATPGRLLDLIGQRIVSLSDIQIFVLDEADRMLDMGFIHDIKRLLLLLPKERQSLFFSATMPPNIVTLSNQILKKPVKIEVSPASTTAETIDQFLYYTNKQHKKDLLLHILKDPKIDQVLLFGRTKHGSDKITRMLKAEKIEALAIHGNKSQAQRQKALADFKSGKIRVLVATDIAARGIDIDGLKYVINYDIPNIAETYVHRIGRSGRAGGAGVSISLCEPEENDFIRDVEKLIRQKLEVIDKHPYPQTEKAMNTAEKKEFEKEKLQKKQEFFANKNKNKVKTPRAKTEKITSNQPKSTNQGKAGKPFRGKKDKI